MKRYVSLDILRGLAILFVIFLHSSLFHYGNIMSIDFDNPSPIITIIGFMLMWGGLFGIISGIVNASGMYHRISTGNKPEKVFIGYFISGLVMLILHYIYFIFFAPALLDLENGNHLYSTLVDLIRNGKLVAPHLERMFYASSLSMIGWNLIIISIVLYFLFRKEGYKKQKRNYIILFILAIIIIILSLIRIPLYPFVEKSFEEKNYLLSFVLSFTVNKNDPILPYLGFGFVGAIIGIALYNDYKKQLKIGLLVSGLLILIIGVVSYILLPDTMLERSIDLSWFFLVIIQLGAFLLMTLGLLVIFDFCKEEKKVKRAKWFIWIRRIGMIALTIFMLETVFSELVARLWSILFPNWNMDMGITFVFAGFNVLLWVLIGKLWEFADYKFSIEWLFVKVVSKFKKSTKMNIKNELYQKNP